MNKNDLRKNLKEARLSLTHTQRKELNDAAYENLISSKEYADSNDIFVFISFGTEIDTHRLIKKMLSDNKNVYIPVTPKGAKKMKLSRLKAFDHLVVGHYCILTPEPEYLDFVDHNVVDLVIVPGLAFDSRGYRVGYGAGYYDKFFADLDVNPKKIGYAFSFQIIDEVPNDEYDIPVDRVITELA